MTEERKQILIKRLAKILFESYLIPRKKAGSQEALIPISSVLLKILKQMAKNKEDVEKIVRKQIEKLYGVKRPRVDLTLNSTSRRIWRLLRVNRVMVTESVPNKAQILLGKCVEIKTNRITNTGNHHIKENKMYENVF